MAVIRVNKTTDYTVMSNAHLKETEMSLKAKGLLSVMLSLPDGWDYSVNGLCAICKENRAAVKSTLTELKQFGYLVVTKKMPNETESGRIEYEYDIYERPQQQAAEKQGTENLYLENLPLENPQQLNTNQSNTEKSNTDNKKKESKRDSFDKIITEYAQTVENREEVTDLLREWLKVRKAKRAAMTDRAIQMNIDKLNSLASASGMTVTEYLKEIICRGWAAFYEITPTRVNKSRMKTTTNRQPSFDLEAAERMAYKRLHPPTTAGEDENIRKRMEALQEQLKG